MKHQGADSSVVFVSGGRTIFSGEYLDTAVETLRSALQSSAAASTKAVQAFDQWAHDLVDIAVDDLGNTCRDYQADKARCVSLCFNLPLHAAGVLTEYSLQLATAKARGSQSTQ